MSFRVGEFTREGEKEFVLGSKDWGRVDIHVWDRRGEGGRREVAITVGDLKKTGALREAGEYGITIVDRDEFVNGLLAVFPELIRKPKFAAGGYVPQPASGRYIPQPAPTWTVQL